MRWQPIRAVSHLDDPGLGRVNTACRRARTAVDARFGDLQPAQHTVRVRVPDFVRFDGPSLACIESVRAEQDGASVFDHDLGVALGLYPRWAAAQQQNREGESSCECEPCYLLFVPFHQSILGAAGLARSSSACKRRVTGRFR